MHRSNMQTPAKPEYFRSESDTESTKKPQCPHWWSIVNIVVYNYTVSLVIDHRPHLDHIKNPHYSSWLIYVNCLFILHTPVRPGASVCCRMNTAALRQRRNIPLCIQPPLSRASFVLAGLARGVAAPQLKESPVLKNSRPSREIQGIPRPPTHS